jgi:hypothetical protein
MNSNTQSLSLSGKLLRTVFLVFASQFLCDTTTNSPNTVDAAYFDFQQTHNIDSCKDYGIFGGKTLESDCVEHCYPLFMEAFDYADIDESANYVIRNTICRCLENGESPTAPKRKVSECWSKAEVWDKSQPLMRCEDDYGIISLTTCQDYCKKIDPKAYKFEGFGGRSKCSCGGIQVCSDSSLVTSAATISGTASSTIVALAMGCFLAVLS